MVESDSCHISVGSCACILPTLPAATIASDALSATLYPASHLVAGDHMVSRLDRGDSGSNALDDAGGLVP